MALALRKQRLQIESAALRQRLGAHAEALAPVFSVVDGARSGWRWILEHPLVPAVAGLTLVVFRPRRAFRLLRRGVLLWQLLRRLRRWTGQPPGADPP